MPAMSLQGTAGSRALRLGSRRREASEMRSTKRSSAATATSSAAKLSRLWPAASRRDLARDLPQVAALAALQA